MWKCARCGEAIDDSFDACWKCGTSVDGVVDPQFRRAAPAEPNDDETDALTASAAELTSDTSGRLGPGMTRREISQLICKTLALLMFALAAFFAVNSAVVIVFLFVTAPMTNYFSWTQFSTSLVLAVPAITAAIVGFFYWKFAPAMARGMVAASPVPVTQFTLSLHDLMIVAFSTAGVFITVAGVKEAVAVAVILFEYDGTLEEFWVSSGTWSALVQLGLGTWLMIGSRGIVNILNWLRTVRWKTDEAGVLAEDKNPPPPSA